MRNLHLFSLIRTQLERRKDYPSSNSIFLLSIDTFAEPNNRSF